MEHRVGPRRRPAVLVFAGHDPSGGAGIQADIESIAQNGAHAMCVITLIAAQNSAGVRSHYSQSLSAMQAQLAALLEERPIQTIKIGAIAEAAHVGLIADLCEHYPELPVVFDPVLAPSQGADFADAPCLSALRDRLLPRVTLLTANRSELHRLAGDDDAEPEVAKAPAEDELSAHDIEAAHCLRKKGCRYVLLTTARANEEVIVHALFGPDDANGEATRAPRTFTSQYLSGEYHGSGCTLASTIAANLAKGMVLDEATRQALDFVARCLSQADHIKARQFIPRRVW